MVSSSPVGPEASLRALSFYEGRLLDEWVGRPTIHRAGFIQCLGPVVDRGGQSLEKILEVVANQIKRRDIVHKIEQSIRDKQRFKYDPLAIRRPPRRQMQLSRDFSALDDGDERPLLDDCRPSTGRYFSRLNVRYRHKRSATHVNLDSRPEYGADHS